MTDKMWRENDPKDTTPVLLPQHVRYTKYPAVSLAHFDHVHILETGECIKNRFGTRCNSRDPFARIKTLDPTPNQIIFMNAVLGVVNALLDGWGRKSGKTNARLMLAKAIIDGDTHDH